MCEYTCKRMYTRENINKRVIKQRTTNFIERSCCFQSGTPHETNDHIYTQQGAFEREMIVVSMVMKW